MVQLKYYMVKKGENLMSTKGLRRIQLSALLLMLLGFSQQWYFVAFCFGILSTLTAFYRRLSIKRTSS